MNRPWRSVEGCGGRCETDPSPKSPVVDQSELAALTEDSITPTVMVSAWFLPLARLANDVPVDPIAAR